MSGAIAQTFAANREETGAVQNLPLIEEKESIQLAVDAAKKKLCAPLTRRQLMGVTVSDGGSDNWAVIASLIESCKLNGVDPYAYLIDVVTKIVNGHPNSAIDDLLPWAYAAPQPLKAVA